MKVRWLCVFAVACAVPACAADREFSEVVHVISDEFHTRPMHIPLFGLVNAFTGVIRPAGAKHIDLAVFENLGPRDSSGRDLTQSIRAAVGSAWTPFVQARSRHETTLLYLRPSGKEWKLLIISIERDEATVVQLLLNPDGLEQWMKSPEDSARRWRGRT
jgi:hypothetical protein